MKDALDLEAMTRAELIELRGRLDKAIATAGERDRQRALKATADLARALGLTPAELSSVLADGVGRGRPAVGRGAGASGMAHFRNPDNVDQTRGGRGRRPAWYSEALAAGRSAEDMKG